MTVHEFQAKADHSDLGKINHNGTIFKAMMPGCPLRMDQSREIKQRGKRVQLPLTLGIKSGLGDL
ncbi:MAG: hypothetical protein RLZZ568_1353 [Cyanobacteriota bacterium]